MKSYCSCRFGKIAQDSTLCDSVLREREVSTQLTPNQCYHSLRMWTHWLPDCQACPISSETFCLTWPSSWRLDAPFRTFASMKSLLRFRLKEALTFLGHSPLSTPIIKKQIKPLLLFSDYFLSSKQYTGHLNDLILKEYLIIYLCFTAVWNDMDVRMKWLV